MKRTVTLLNVVASMFVLGLVRQEPAQAEGACSLATLQGDYIETGRSDFAPRGLGDPNNYPVAYVGVTNFDGKGSWSAAFTISRGGDISRVTGTGTYTLNDDCTGMIGGPPNWEMVVTRDGREGEWIRVDQGNVSRVSIKKQ